MTVHGIIGSDSKEGQSARQSCRVVLPADVQPGESRLKIHLGNGKLVEAEVPKGARGGDTLLITLNGDKSWTGALVGRELQEDSQEKNALVSAGDDIAREFVAVVPDGVTPGQDQLMFSDGHGRQLTITVPRLARAGDQLLFKQDRRGQFRCCLSRSQAHEKLDSRTRPATLAPRRDLVIAVPPDAKPGETMLPIDIGIAGGTPFGIRVPATALPGDHITLTLDEQRNEWIASIIRGVKTDVKWKHLEFPSVDADPSDVFDKLVTAVRSAGAFISRKISRGTAPPLNVLGVVACADIQAGEDLVRMPTELHLTAANLKMLFPEIFRMAAGMFFKGRHEEAAFTACVARLIGDSVNRCSDFVETLAYAAPRLETEAAIRVWEIYARALASESFDRHPLVRRLNDEDKVIAAVMPSKEHQHLNTFVGDIMLFYEQFSSRVQAELLGSGFTLASYWQARLSVLSRAFSLDGKDCLVPVCDFFNHHPQPGAEWHWDAETQAMVLTATQSYKCGEEILISYGAKSNTSMFRCYGFVMHPSAEPSWGYVCLPQNFPEDLYRMYLPARMANFVFQLDTQQVHDSLVMALNACLEHGADAQEFLHAVCRRAVSAYEDDVSMRPALEALRLARAADAASSAWWQCISGDIASCFPCDEYPDWSEALLCMRMSEYLCLTAHLEVFDVLYGVRSEDQCLAGARAVRETLLAIFPMLRAGHQVLLEESMP
mmetsp:Transcript_92014/g.168751  ORF Transcript_92014/g.168751 Transcript_92014/m.168751 type:complete len:718 (-) Transcript_92014:86-2239(-)